MHKALRLWSRLCSAESLAAGRKALHTFDVLIVMYYIYGMDFPLLFTLSSTSSHHFNQFNSAAQQITTASFVISNRSCARNSHYIITSSPLIQLRLFSYALLSKFNNEFHDEF